MDVYRTKAKGFNEYGTSEQKAKTRQPYPERSKNKLNFKFSMNKNLFSEQTNLNQKYLWSDKQIPKNNHLSGSYYSLNYLSSVYRLLRIHSNL